MKVVTQNYQVLAIRLRRAAYAIPLNGKQSDERLAARRQLLEHAEECSRKAKLFKKKTFLMML